MKRKAPETLLEFSEYILPLKRTKFTTPEPSEMSPQPVSYAYYEINAPSYNYGYNPYENRVNNDYLEELQSSGESGINTRSSVSSPSSTMHDYYFELIIVDDLLAKKPASNKAPLEGFVEAIKWLIEHHSLVQREVAYALSVSPSTLSLYLNKTQRNHGWRDLEVKIDLWLRSKLNPESRSNE